MKFQCGQFYSYILCLFYKDIEKIRIKRHDDLQGHVLCSIPELQCPHCTGDEEEKIRLRKEEGDVCMAIREIKDMKEFAYKYIPEDKRKDFIFKVIKFIGEGFSK